MLAINVLTSKTKLSCKVRPSPEQMRRGESVALTTIRREAATAKLIEKIPHKPSLPPGVQ